MTLELSSTERYSWFKCERNKYKAFTDKLRNIHIINLGENFETQHAFCDRNDFIRFIEHLINFIQNPYSVDLEIIRTQRYQKDDETINKVTVNYYQPETNRKFYTNSKNLTYIKVSTPNDVIKAYEDEFIIQCRRDIINSFSKEDLKEVLDFLNELKVEFSKAKYWT